jgi:hypothetical protein
MTTINPQYITDTAGKKLVVLPLEEFDKLIDELEDIEDVKLYDEAKKNDDAERILFTDYLKLRKVKNALKFKKNLMPDA